jgi:hypothetical protein
MSSKIAFIKRAYQFPLVLSQLQLKIQRKKIFSLSCHPFPSSYHAKDSAAHRALSFSHGPDGLAAFAKDLASPALLRACGCPGRFIVWARSPKSSVFVLFN